MSDFTKKDFLKLFSQGFEEVVLPAMEDLGNEIRKEFKSEIAPLKTAVNRLENKLDRMNDKLLDHGNRLDDIESVPIVAHHIKKK